jgi:hypothetical protein
MATNGFAIANIQEALVSRAFPTITLWNRLEGRPRTENFSRALRAEIRDALWMVTRQWQMGEYRGDDAGSPVFAKVHVATTELTKFKAGAGPATEFDRSLPLEATVEQRPVSFSLDLRLLMGRQWLKMLAPLPYRQEFIEQYPIAQPDPSRKGDAPICAHRESWASVAAVAGRMMDGAALYLHLVENPANHAYDGIGVNPGDEGAIDTAATSFRKWFEALLYQRPANDAWEPDRLEYRFSCSAPQGAAEKVFAADEYYHGHLDWYNFAIDSATIELAAVEETPATPDPQTTHSLTLIPTQVAFDGMPNTRWWTFEDGKTSFGDIKPDPTDLPKLLLIEFGLVYANDWFLIPFQLPVGSIARIRGMAVTNVFGERTWIEPAGSGTDENWQRWSMFTINTTAIGDPADTSLLLMPTSPKVMDGAPLEEVMLVRDEMANMVWGIERTIPLSSGGGKPGAEAAVETVQYFKRLILESGGGAAPGPLLPNEAKIRYELMSSVPENWIPFIPVRVPGDPREIQLQRASLLRMLEGDPDPVPRPVQPRTTLLRQGLDKTVPEPYFIHEEEVPRAGVRATLAYRRVRSKSGKPYVWLGVRKETGRGESWSGLAFDRIVDIPETA